MIYAVIIFLWLSINLYLILGGADFGAGVVELFAEKDFKKRTQDIMYRSIGPIWEANHMWLIIAVVIMFVGFPAIYSEMANHLHIPLVIMLMGIIARGTSFTFRNYDAIQDKWHNLYDLIFTYSSFVTPLFLGIIAASMVSGSIDPNANNFLDAYIFSWLSWFNVSVGVFTVSLCGFLAAIFSLNTVRNPQDLAVLKKMALGFTFSTFFLGGVVFVVSIWQKIPLIDWIFRDYIGYLAVITATLVWIGVIRLVKTNHFRWSRVLAGVIVFCILVAVSYSHYPDIVLFKDGSTLSLMENSANEKVIDMLAYALLGGSVFILPFFIYLMYAFNKQNTRAAQK